MTSLEQRQTLLPLIEKACHDGARLAQACRQRALELAGLGGGESG